MATRRNFIKQGTLAGVVTTLLPTLLTAKEGNSINTKRILRAAHITDVHLLDQQNAKLCLSRVLREINTMGDRPDFILNTGDTVMDENNQTRETVQASWDTWTKILKAENKLELKSIVGNHDVWYGPDAKLDAEYKNDKRYGKQWAIEMLSLPARYYSFEKSGWHFIGLDSINGSDGYQLDDEQFEWLKGQLTKIPAASPVCVLSHVPILSMSSLVSNAKNKPIKDVKFPVGYMHNDHQRIKDLFYQHKNVKLSLSGHVHYVDAVEYLGVKYLCNGAVSGNWWKSPLTLDEFPPVYTIIDFFADGTTTHKHIFYNTTV